MVERDTDGAARKAAVTQQEGGTSMVEQQYSPEALALLETEIKEHASAHRVIADNTASKCVDGGYKVGEAEGKLARPGGDLGTSMLLLSLGYSPREAFDKVRAFCKANGRKYGWHTDTHEGHHGVVVGCGHCNEAIKAGEKYGVEGSQVQELLNIVREAQETSPEDMELVTLDREHKEKAILVITGTQTTVRPWDGGESQYFIYDKTRDMEMMEQLAEFLGINADDLKAAVDNQTNATLGSLGSSKGKPLFAINVDDQNSITVDHVGFAPTSA